VRNVAKEIPAITLRCADISGFEDRPADQLCSAMAGEALRRVRQSMVCLRPNGRYVEELFPLAPPPLGRLRLRERGTVLITGGVGGLGLKIAGTLFEAAQAGLVLTSRWKPPPREDWIERAKQDDKIGLALRALVELERRGAELLVVRADMGDIGSLKTAIAKAESHFGSIHGVVHAAGINTDGPAINTVPEIAEPAFEAKVHGAFNLEEVLKDNPLDFLVYFSSRSSYTPAPGQTVYTASNSVLDILSHQRSLKQPGLNCAIGWAAWQEVGMAAAMAEGRFRDPKGSIQHERQHRADRVIDHPLLDGRYQGSRGSAIYWSRIKDGDHWICEHRFKGSAVIAGVTIVECLRASYVDLLETGNAIELSQIAFVRPIFVENQGTDIEIEYTPFDAGHRFEVRSRPVGHSGGWTINTVGRAARVSQPPAVAPKIPDLPTTGFMPGTPEGFSLGFRPGTPEGFSLGFRWDCILGTKVDGNTIWAKAHLGENFRADIDSFGLHPATFDRALNDPSKIFGVLGVPYTLDRILIHDRLGAEYFIRSTRRTLGSADAFDALFVDSDGNVLVETEGFVSREVVGSSLSDMLTAVGDDREIRSAGLAANQQIVVTQPGNLDSLQSREFETPAPREGEVRIDVIAAGLNFRDVLSALGQLPMKTGESHPRIGSECSGIVTAVGDGVPGIQPGDPVVALAPNAFAGSVSVHADLLMPVPNRISMEDAAGIPIIFLTADYAINTLAALKKAERILIHAAAGGVGLAAVQLAQNIGAEIFATAGHPDKREYLKRLGVDHVMDSRSLDFVQETRELTNGEGVDVVLNSLAGEYISAGLSLLRYRGRFLEIGKRDIISDSKIGLLPFQNNLAYHAIDLGPMIERRDPMLVDLFDSLMLRFARGELSPIPTDVVPISDIARAMQRMARAEHVGKIVLKVRDDPDPWRSIFKKFQEMYGRGVPVDEGLGMFRRLLSANQVPHYVMATGRKLDEVGSHEHRIGRKAGTRPNLSTDYHQPTTPEEQALARIWESALGVAPIGIDDDFFDLGGDSITAIQTQFSVADRFGINLSASLVIEFPTIAKIAEHIRGLCQTNVMRPE
jgi:NADPH:quinone reductase-like Zn-dependent oxidoreductase/NAD(P)-dependent dehydrogenase (short-subunit alcohol dehydrogenase family)/acyl carrier protein